MLCTFEHESFSGGTTPVETNEELLFQYTFLLQQDYASVYEWGISSITLGQLGTSLPGGNIQPMATRDDGTSSSIARQHSLYRGPNSFLGEARVEAFQ